MTPERKALFIEGAGRQGGHSKRGGELADELGITFPLTMEKLEHRAKMEGADPNELWPWLANMRAGRK